MTGAKTCSLLALVWCRRLAPELTPWGKVAFLDATVRHPDRPLTCDHRRLTARFTGLDATTRPSERTR